MNKFWNESTATPHGWLSVAAEGSQPSPLQPAAPLPATVFIKPVGRCHARIRSLPASATYKMLSASVTPAGWDSCASTPRPPSPPYPPAQPTQPLPTTVVIMPFGVTARTLLFSESTTYKTLLALSTASPHGLESCASVASPLSPPKPANPFPAHVVITWADANTARTRLPSDTNRLPAASSATAIGELSSADVAGPPSPRPANWDKEVSAAPKPAYVVMTPLVELTKRTTLLTESAQNKSPAADIAMPDGPFNCASVALPPSPA